MRFELAAEDRGGLGKGANRRLRRAGRVPAVVYGGGKQPDAIAVDHRTLLLQMQREAFYTSILTLKKGAEAVDVVVKDVQRHPYKPEILHLDFQRIVADEEITLNVPIHFRGEAVAKGAKDQGGVIEQVFGDDGERPVDDTRSVETLVGHPRRQRVDHVHGLGDLGQHFGTSRPQWSGASGVTLLTEAARALSADLT